MEKKVGKRAAFSAMVCGAQYRIERLRGKVRRPPAADLTPLQYSAVQYSAVQCSAVPCRAVPCGAGRERRRGRERGRGRESVRSHRG